MGDHKKRCMEKWVKVQCLPRTCCLNWSPSRDLALLASAFFLPPGYSRHFLLLGLVSSSSNPPFFSLFSFYFSLIHYDPSFRMHKPNTREQGKRVRPQPTSLRKHACTHVRFLKKSHAYLYLYNICKGQLLKEMDWNVVYVHAAAAAAIASNARLPGM